MSTICTCVNANKTTGFACNYSAGCRYITEKGALKEPENPFSFAEGVAKATKIINDTLSGKIKPQEPPIDLITSIDHFPKRYEFGMSIKMGVDLNRVHVEMPNGNMYRITHDEHTGGISIIKINDEGGTEQITIHPGGGVNAITII